MEPQGPSIVKDQRQRVPLGFLTRLCMDLKQTGLLLVRLQKIYLYLIKQARFLFTMLCDIIQRCYLSFNCPVASKIMVLSIFHGIIFFSFAFGYIVKQDTKFGIDCHKQSLFWLNIFEQVWYASIWVVKPGAVSCAAAKYSQTLLCRPT